MSEYACTYIGANKRVIHTQLVPSACVYIYPIHASA